MDFYTSLSVGKNSFSELVFSDGEVVSDLVWIQKPNLAINAGLELNLKRGFYCFSEFSFIPKNIPMQFTDADFANGKMFSYSEHLAKTKNSFVGFLGLGWKFLLAEINDVKFFVSPAMRLDFFKFGSYGYDGYSYRIDALGEKSNEKVYDGKVIEYNLKLFSSEFLLNFFTCVKSKLELKASLGFGVYSCALAVDYHILRFVKFYDIFNFHIFLFSSELAAKYLVARNFGFFANTKLLICHSNQGKTKAHFLDTDEVISYEKGASGFKTTQINFSLGVFFRIRF